MHFLLWRKFSTFLTNGRKKPLNFKLFIAAIFPFKFSKEFFSSEENFPPLVEKRRQMTIFLCIYLRKTCKQKKEPRLLRIYSISKPNRILVVFHHIPTNVNMGVKKSLKLKVKFFQKYGNGNGNQ